MAKTWLLWNKAFMNIVLAVSGSISAYKSIDVTRELTKKGHKVRVVLTRGALEFVVPKIFTYLGAEKVYQPQDDFTEMASQESELDGAVLHVALAKWADQLVIAPLSANTLSNLCQAKANDLLSSLFLAWRREKPISIFPAMNSQMLSHPFVQDNFKKLSELSFLWCAPTGTGLLACNDKGEGKLLSVEEIIALIETRTLLQTQKTTLITTGATVAPLDNVRYLTNAASGKTAIPFIEEALKRGHKVICLAGKFSTNNLQFYKAHPHFELQYFTTTESLASKIETLFPLCDVYISSAAIGDIEFIPSNEKLKKDSLGNQLEIKKTRDILAHVLYLKKDHQKIIGFAAESQLSDEVLTKKYQRKPVDLLVGTQVDSGLQEKQSQGFGTEEAQYRFMKGPNDLSPLVQLSKKEMVSRACLEIYGEL